MTIEPMNREILIIDSTKFAILELSNDGDKVLNISVEHLEPETLPESVSLNSESGSPEPNAGSGGREAPNFLSNVYLEIGQAIRNSKREHDLKILKQRTKYMEENNREWLQIIGGKMTDKEIIKIALSFLLGNLYEASEELDRELPKEQIQELKEKWEIA